MALKGDLASVGLADVFQMLAHNQKVGILSIHGREAWRALYFDRRGVTLYYNETRFLDRLLEGLVRRNFLTSELLDQYRRQNAGDSIGTVEALLTGGLVPEDAFLESFRTQMEEEIYDLFLWEKVHWEFLEGESAVDGREGVVNENFFFSADSLIMEAARRLDEWVFIREEVPSPYEVFEPIPGCAAHEVVGLDELTLSILDLVDGKRSVSRITEVSQITSFQVHKSLSTLRQKDFVQPLPADKLLRNANECIAEARLGDGIKLLERAVQVGAGLPDAHLLAAKTYEMQSEAARAGWHYKRYADLKLEAGDVDEAVNVLEHMTTLLPTDLDAWERLVHALMQHPSPRLDPHAVGKDLIELHLELEEVDRARGVLEDLLEARPNDIELKKTLISVHTKAGDTRRVMELYESIADDLVAQKDPIGAVRYLQKILMIDRNRREISDRIKQLYVLDEKHRSRRRRTALLVAGLFCVGALGAMYYLYDRNVRSAYDALDVEPFVKVGDYSGAIRMYTDFLDRYPLSFSVEADVQRDIDRVKGMQLLVEEKRASERRKLAAAAREKRAQYMKLWSAYKAMELDMSLALRRLEEIQKLAREAGEAADKRFLATNKIELAIRTTRDYLATAERLEKDAAKEFGRGKFEEARKIALQLHEQHPYTPSAARSLVPVHIVTDPPGAKVEIAGQPVRGGAEEILRTPMWVRVPHANGVRIRITRLGYEDRFASLKGSDKSPLRLLLHVKPVAVFRLDGEPVTGIGVGDARGIVGLKGGRVAGVDLGTGAQLWRQRLEGLDEVRGTPVVTGEIGVFATTHGRLRAVRLGDGETVWSARVEGGIRTELVLVPGGVVVGSGKGKLHCFGASNGDLYWTKPTGAAPSADPVWDGDQLWYANRGGLLMALDVEAVDDPILRRTDLPGIVGRPRRVGRHVAVLTSEGRLRGFRINRRGEEMWSVRFGTTGADAYFLPDSAGLIVITADGQVRVIDPHNPENPVVRTRQLAWRLAGEPLRTERAIYFVLKGDKGDTHLTSLSAEDLSTRWDYTVDGGIRGRPTLEGDKIFVVAGDGRIHVLE